MTWAHARQVPGTAASKGVRIRGYRFRRGCVEGFPGTDPTPGLRADIFRPQGRMGPNEPCHQLLAPRVLKHFHRYPTAAKQVFLAAKRSIFANHHTRNAVKENRTAAHRTWRERGVHGAVAIDAARLTTGILERVHLAVQNDTALLHPPIVATAENLPGRCRARRGPSCVRSRRVVRTESKAARQLRGVAVGPRPGEHDATT